MPSSNSVRDFQGDFSLFQFLNNFLQSLETLFKFRQRDFAPSSIVMQLFGRTVQCFRCKGSEK